MKVDENKLKDIKQIITILNELDMLDILWNDSFTLDIFNMVEEKCLTCEDEYYYSYDSEEIDALRPYIIERFGENYALVEKDGKYILLSYALKEDDVDYWDISKINVDGLEKARKIAFLVSHLDKID